MTNDENPMELAEMLSPYQKMEGNIEVENPFYSGLMLERKSFDGGNPSFRRDSGDYNKIKNNRSVIDKNNNNSCPFKPEKSPPLRLDSDITKLQRITPILSVTPQNKTPTAIQPLVFSEQAATKILSDLTKTANISPQHHEIPANKRKPQMDSTQTKMRSKLK